MNNVTYVLKYTEYLIRKCRSFLMTDLYFHTVRLKKKSGKHPDINSPTTLSEKYVIVWFMTTITSIPCLPINSPFGNT